MDSPRRSSQAFTLMEIMMVVAIMGLIMAMGVPNLMKMQSREPMRKAVAQDLPDLAQTAILMLADQLDALAAQINALERRLLAWHRQNDDSQRLATIPGVGIITATALSASITDPSLFRSGREFAAFLGLVPRQNSSGGKDRLGRISKKGDGYLRKLLVVGATSVIRRAHTGTSTSALWIKALLERRPARVVTVAMANKTARIAWAVLARGDVYRAPTMA